MLPVDFTKNSLCEALTHADGEVKGRKKRQSKSGVAGGGQVALQEIEIESPQKQHHRQQQQQQQLEYTDAVCVDNSPPTRPAPVPQQQQQQLPSWSTGLFSCGQNTSFAALACCCPCVASGLIYERLHHPFGTAVVASMCIPGVHLARRSMIAIETGIRPQSCAQLFSALACCACAMAQESRELDILFVQQQQQQQQQQRGRTSLPKTSTDFVVDITKQKRQQARERSAGWSSGLFDCIGASHDAHPHSCCYGLLCPCYLSSHSMNAVTGVPCLLSLLCPTLCFGRTIIRSQLDLPGSSFDDVCLTLACLPCATCQEARHVQSLNGPFDLQLGQCMFLVFCGCIICFANS